MCACPRVVMYQDFAAKGRDLAAPAQQLTLDGVQYKLVFNNRAARIAEDVYEDVYKRPDKGYFDILGDAGKGRYAAMQALYYGALIAGGAEMTFAEFDSRFSLGSVEGVSEIIMRELSKSLPPEDTSPNADSQTGMPDDGPGAG